MGQSPLLPQTSQPQRDYKTVSRYSQKSLNDGIHLKKVGNLKKVRSRDRYQASIDDGDDEVNLNNEDTDEGNVDALEDETDNFDNVQNQYGEQPNTLSSQSNLHLGQLVFNNHNYV